MLRALRHLLVLMLLCCLPWQLASAAEDKAPPAPAGAPDREQDRADWRQQLAEWETQLGDAEAYIADLGQQNNLTSDKHYETLRGLLKGIEARRAATTQRIAGEQALLDALGPPPAEGEPAESEDIAKLREQYRSELSRLRERQSQMELTATRATQFQEELSTLRRDALLDLLSQRYPRIWQVEMLPTALAELVAQTQELSEAPLAWYTALDDTAREGLVVWPFFGILLLAVSAGWWLRRWVLTRYGRDPREAAPSSSRRVVAAVAEGVGRGLIPALLFGGLWLWLNRPDGAIDGLFAQGANAVLLAAGFFTVSTALTRAVMAPELPAWRLTAQSAESAKAIGRAVIGLLMVLALELLYQRATQGMAGNAELRSLSVLVLVVLKGGFLLLLLRRRWWWGMVESGEISSSRGEARLLVQRILLAVIWLAALAALAGYSTLGEYLISRLLMTVSILLLLVAARALLRELSSALITSRFLRDVLGFSVAGLQRFKFWFRVLLEPPLYLFTLFWLVQVWGVPQQDLLRWAESALTGFRVGAITISLADIAFAMLVFATVMAMTRLTQRGLLHHILPQLTSNEGLRHSMAALSGYVGLILAIMLFIAALGINLESIALVAGALSVGIGFGLQNVVSNFVSGLILIVERPIKVGDWVQVSGSEGFVQKINFRATELETFQRASVIIPNAELISTPVINMTYQNRFARFEIQVGVDYDSDPEQVRDILLRCASEHPLVSKQPPPVVLFQDFADSALLFELRGYIGEATGKGQVCSDIRFAIFRAFADAGIGIPFPQRVVHFVGGKPAAAEPEPPTQWSDDA
jgi:small-conductance mechanosensitive channel